VPRRDAAKFALDTSCLVALLAAWHPRHRETAADYDGRVKRGQRPVVAGHALMECFSVLTRLPAPLAASPASVEQVLSGFLSGGVEVADMSAAACRLTISELARRGMGGGRIYDGIIALCSFQAGAAVLLTWNLSHLLSVAPPGLTVTEPATWP